MSMLQFAWKNIVGDRFRSVAILACAALVAGLALCATFVVRGAEDSLRSNLQRLGADVLVLPWGTITEKIGGVRLMSAAIDRWMPRAYADQVAKVPGVAAVSPQLHLATLKNSPYGQRPEVFLVAFDPASDFAVQPWLEGGAQRALGRGEVYAGAQIVVPAGERLAVFGYELRLAGRLLRTGTSIDQSLFVSFDTAAEIIQASNQKGQQALKAIPGTISAVMVKGGLNEDPHALAVRILESVRGVVPLETPDIFQAERRQMIGVLQTLLGLLGVIWMLALAFMGIAFSVAANERRTEIGVLRALGFTQWQVLKALLLEGALLAVLGGALGVSLTSVALFALGDQVVQLAGLPLQFPSPLGLVSLSLAGQAVALISVTLAAFIPAWRISKQEAALAMRD